MKIINLLYFLIFLNASSLHAQSCVLLHLPFEGSSTGKGGESPSYLGSVSYGTGINGNAATIAPGDFLRFDKVNNIDEKTGTLEFWINPRNLWTPLGHEYFLSFGSSGGLVAMKDGTNSARMLFSQYSTPNPELDVAFSIGSWDMNAWHYLVYTWDMDTLNLYMDGQLVNADQYCINMPPITCFTFPAISASEIQIGPCGGSVDELIIHGCAKSADYILNRFNNPLDPIEPVEPIGSPESSDSLYEITVYELISPNHDGHNDVFKIENIEKYPNHELSILNTWGDKIFHSKKYDNSWNATSLPDGTYYYHLKVQEGNTTKTYKGRLIIQR